MSDAELLLMQQSDELEVGSNVFSPCRRSDDEFDLVIDEEFCC